MTHTKFTNGEGMFSMFEMNVSLPTFKIYPPYLHFSSVVFVESGMVCLCVMSACMLCYKA